MCQRDELFISDNDAIVDFPADNNYSYSFKFKTKTAGRKGKDGTKNRVPLKCSSNFWNEKFLKSWSDIN